MSYHHNTNPSQGSGEDRHMTAEIFMMLHSNDQSGLNQDVVNAVMQDRQAPADILEEHQQFQHHQRMHQLQMMQQQQALQQRGHHQNQHNLWEQQQQQQQYHQHGQQYHDPNNYQQQQQQQQAQYDQYGHELQQLPRVTQQAAVSPIATKPKKTKTKKTNSKQKSNSKQLPTAKNPPNAKSPPSAAAAAATTTDAAVTVVTADAAAVATAAATAAAIQEEPQVQVPTGPPGKYSVGTFVIKHFLFFGWFQGRIIHYDWEHKIYKIQYEDGDLEELSEKEVTELFERAERAKPRPQQSEEMRRRPKRRARYQEGTKIKKLFYGLGWFEGTIESYDDETEFYTVSYSDGDREELDEEEVFDVLMDPRNHKKPRAWVPRKLSKKEKDEYNAVTFDPILHFWLPIPPPPPPPPPPAKYAKGTEVYKFFEGHGWYKGKVIDYDPSSEFYAVKYEDGDEEDMENHDIDKSLAYSEYGPIGKYSVGKEIKKFFPGHGLFTGKIIRYSPSEGLYKVQYEDKDKEDLDEGELKKILKQMQVTDQDKMNAENLKSRLESLKRKSRGVHYLPPV